MNEQKFRFDVYLPDVTKEGEEEFFLASVYVNMVALNISYDQNIRVGMIVDSIQRFLNSATELGAMFAAWVACNSDSVDGIVVRQVEEEEEVSSPHADKLIGSMPSDEKISQALRNRLLGN